MTCLRPTHHSPPPLVCKRLARLGAHGTPRTNQKQEAWVYSHGGPIRRRKRSRTLQRQDKKGGPSVISATCVAHEVAAVQELGSVGMTYNT
eukprot:630768-Prorocentrum_minimum.AAC.1